MTDLHLLVYNLEQLELDLPENLREIKEQIFQIFLYFIVITQAIMVIFPELITPLKSPDLVFSHRLQLSLMMILDIILIVINHIKYRRYTPLIHITGLNLLIFSYITFTVPVANYQFLATYFLLSLIQGGLFLSLKENIANVGLIILGLSFSHFLAPEISFMYVLPVLAMFMIGAFVLLLNSYFMLTLNQERKNEAKDVEQQVERYQDLFNNTPVAIWEVDVSYLFDYIKNLDIPTFEEFENYIEAEDNIETLRELRQEVNLIDVNQTTLKLYKVDSQEEFKNHQANMYDPNDLTDLKISLKTIYKNKKQVTYESQNIDANGNKFITYVKWIALAEKNKKYDNIIVTKEDITERVKMENRIKKYNKELEESNRELEQFAYIASHDLKEPLRKIQAFSGRLATKFGEELDERGQMYIDRLQSATSRMQQLIDDLLTFSRISRFEKEKENVNLNDIMESAEGNLQGYIRETEAQVEVGELETLPGHNNLLILLFQNLIHNAIKYSKDNVETEIRIHGRYTYDDEGNASSYQISVEDNGIGFDQKYGEKVFEIFQRLHTKFEYEGTGIGLALCKKIVSLHNGSISAQSTLNEGSTFFVELPLE